MKNLFLTFLVIVMNLNARTNFDFAGEITFHKVFEYHIEFYLTNAKFNLYILKDNLIRFRFTQQNEFSRALSYAVIDHGLAAKFRFEEKTDFFEIVTKELIVRISKHPCRVSIFDLKMNLINEDEKSFGVSFDYDEVRCHKTLLDGEQFYGLGEKTGSLAKRGGQYTMWNSDRPDYTTKEDPLYKSIPFFIGVKEKKAYGIFFDNTYKSYFNMGASNNRFYWFGAEKGEMDYYFIYGPEIKKVISDYTLLTGRMELPPMWALGYQQSKWSYYPESTVRNLAKTFRDKQIPCDVIYLDIHYMDEYRVFTWNKERFPNPTKMLNDLWKDGFKIITIVDPGVKADTANYSIAREGLEQNLFVKYPDGSVYQGEVWPSWAYFPDFTKKETRNWWGNKNAMLIEQGLAGIWNDMNEPAVWGQAFPDIVQFDDNGFKANHKKIHNVYGLEMARATFEGLKRNFPDKRPFILTRAAFAGIQRYAAVWTGDNSATEDHLKLACTMTLGLGLSGVPFAGSDVGGFFRTPSQRLFTRWMQLGAFTPFFRGHTIINTNDQEPWAFGEEVERWVKDVMDLRYRLLPYIYNEFYNSTISGLPPARAMFLNYQYDEECYSEAAQFQFMFGENLLVAPVLSEKENFKKVYLPEGRWINWQKNEIYDGKSWVVVEAPIWEIPFFLREGGIIPIQQRQNFVGEKKIEETELIIFPGKSSEYTLYEDDGISADYQNGKYSLTKFKLEMANSNTVLQIDRLKNDFKSDRKFYLLKIYGVEKLTTVSLNNLELKSAANQNELDAAEESFYFDGQKKILFAKVKDDSKINISW